MSFEDNAVNITLIIRPFGLSSIENIDHVNDSGLNYSSLKKSAKNAIIESTQKHYLNEQKCAVYDLNENFLLSGTFKGSSLPDFANDLLEHFFEEKLYFFKCSMMKTELSVEQSIEEKGINLSSHSLAISPSEDPLIKHQFFKGVGFNISSDLKSHFKKAFKNFYYEDKSGELQYHSYYDILTPKNSLKSRYLDKILERTLSATDPNRVPQSLIPRVYNWILSTDISQKAESLDIEILMESIYSSRLRKDVAGFETLYLALINKYFSSEVEVKRENTTTYHSYHVHQDRITKACRFLLGKKWVHDLISKHRDTNFYPPELLSSQSLAYFSTARYQSTKPFVKNSQSSDDIT